MSDAQLILITGGGTGGHIFPGIAAAEALRTHGARVHWLGTEAGMEARLVPAAGIPITFLRVRGIRGKGLVQRVLAPFVLCIALLHAVVIMRRLRPSCVLGTGGYVAGPGGVAAWLCGCPLVIHEQNSVAGTTNRLLARFARRVLLGIPGAFAWDPRAEFVGNPVRAVIASLPLHAAAQTERPLRVLVIGGSQGARILNQTLPAALALMSEDCRPDVLHQTGRAEHQACTSAYRDAGVAARIEAFIDDMAEAYQWADLVVCRAGALTVSELAAAGVASILVPLPNAIDDHQRLNARWLADAGAAIAIDQSTLSPDELASQLRTLVRERGLVDEMARAARTLARPQAAAVVAQRCLEVAA